MQRITGNLVFFDPFSLDGHYRDLDLLLAGVYRIAGVIAAEYRLRGFIRRDLDDEVDAIMHGFRSVSLPTGNYAAILGLTLNFPDRDVDVPGVRLGHGVAEEDRRAARDGQCAVDGDACRAFHLDTVTVCGGDIFCGDRAAVCLDACSHSCDFTCGDGAAAVCLDPDSVFTFNVTGCEVTCFIRGANFNRAAVFSTDAHTICSGYRLGGDRTAICHDARVAFDRAGCYLAVFRGHYPDPFFRSDIPGLNGALCHTDCNGKLPGCADVSHGDRAVHCRDACASGFKKEDIKIDIENDCLTISSERKLDEDKKQKNFIKRERFYGSYSRSFDVSGVNVDGIEAEYTDGVLKLTMPKKVETVFPPTRRLEIK